MNEVRQCLIATAKQCGADSTHLQSRSAERFQGLAIAESGIYIAYRVSSQRMPAIKLNGGYQMNAHQRRQRVIFWRGSFPVILGFVVLVIALVLADRIAPVSTQETDDVNLTPHVEHSTDLRSQEAAPIAIPSQQVD